MNNLSVPLWEGSSVIKLHPSASGWRIMRAPDGTVFAMTMYWKARQSSRTWYGYTIATLPSSAPRVVREMLAKLT